MNIQETAAVLAKAAAYDNRTIGDTNVLAWHDALADLDVADCLQAVTHHHRTTDAYLMPVHIRRIAVDLQRDRHRAEREHREQLAAQAEIAERGHTTDRQPEVTDLLTRLRDKLGASDPNVLRRAEWVRSSPRAADAGPNPLYKRPPPPGGWPVPDDGDLVASW